MLHYIVESELSKKNHAKIYVEKFSSIQQAQAQHAWHSNGKDQDLTIVSIKFYISNERREEKKEYFKQYSKKYYKEYKQENTDYSKEYSEKYRQKNTDYFYRHIQIEGAF